MHTITVDDEQIAVTSLQRLLRKVDPDGIHEGFIYADDFLRAVEEKLPDIAFVDIDLAGTDGITLTQQLTERYPELNIILYTGHPEFKPDAMDAFASGYLVKPVTLPELQTALSHLRHPLRTIKVRCFGHFEVFVNDKPMKFERKDSKEVLAYMIDRRGAEVSDDELRALLWPDEEDLSKKRNYIHNIIYDIRNTFAANGLEEVIISRHGFYSVNVSKLSCDYYDYLDGKPVKAAILHEYMEQFGEWSRKTKHALFP
jgi:two-component SAPR family response regulator